MPKINTHQLRTRVVAVLLILAALIGVVLFLLDQRAQHIYDNVVEAADSFSMPGAAIPRPDASTQQGRGLSAYLCLDVSCPRAIREWYIATPQGSAEQPITIALTLLRQNGYTSHGVHNEACEIKLSGCAVNGRKQGTVAQVLIRSTHTELPNQPPPDGQQWRVLRLIVQRDTTE